MSNRIPTKLKAQLGEELGNWYRLFGKVQPRKAYREDDEDGGAASAQPLFMEHPFLAEMPLGASSDLTSIISNDKNTLEEAEKRSAELTEELQHRLSLTLEQKKQKKFLHEYHSKPQPF